MNDIGQQDQRSLPASHPACFVQNIRTLIKLLAMTALCWTKKLILQHAKEFMFKIYLSTTLHLLD